jgi:UDP-N-acetylmuramyl pentapeptide phosphotransferase/UDP-N-acetylglucosamine-1-phosphate transferase
MTVPTADSSTGEVVLAASETGIVNRIEQAFEPARELLVPVLSNPAVLAVWLAIVAVCLGVLWWDLRQRNRVLGSFMKFVWTLTVAYSGPLGLAVYWYTGRTQIVSDSLWKRGFRSTSH